MQIVKHLLILLNSTLKIVQVGTHVMLSNSWIAAIHNFAACGYDLCIPILPLQIHIVGFNLF